MTWTSSPDLLQRLIRKDMGLVCCRCSSAMPIRLWPDAASRSQSWDHPLFIVAMTTTASAEVRIALDRIADLLRAHQHLFAGSKPHEAVRAAVATS